jgi:hypothetical protein
MKERPLDSMERTTETKTDARPACMEIREYRSKLLEFAHANTSAAFDFAQQACRVKSPSELIELSSEQVRTNNTQMLTEQAKQLTELAQKVALAGAKPLQDSVAKSFDHAA